MKKEYYGYEGQERLVDDPADVVDNLVTGEEDYQDYPIKVHVFRPMEAIGNPTDYAIRILEELLETLDDEYGDPERDNTEPTRKMREASLELAKVMKEEYVPWMCEPTGEVLEFSKEDALKIVGDV